MKTWLIIWIVFVAIDLFFSGLAVGEGHLKEAGYNALGAIAFAILALREAARIAGKL